jgi:hypothetical protein
MRSGVYRSTDNGGLWVPVNTGLPASPDILALFSYDRPIPFGPTIFAGLNQGGVYLSKNAGVSWIDAGAGLVGPGLRRISSLASKLSHFFAQLWLFCDP